jgi:Holliday junction resolvase
MAMTPEARVKRLVTTILKERNIYYFYPATHGYGSSGTPDIVACYKSYFIGIECKSNLNKPTALQEHALNEITRCGGKAIWLNESNATMKVRALLQEIDNETQKEVV